MIGQIQLPPEFFSEFYRILEFTPEDAQSFQERLHEVTQRKFLQEQLAILPEVEQQVFSQIMEKDGVSAATINEFLEDRISEERRLGLWHETLVHMWQEVLDTVSEVATAEQKADIKQLVHTYIEQQAQR